MKTPEHHNWLIIPWHCWLVVAVRCQCWDTGTRQSINGKNVITDAITSSTLGPSIPASPWHSHGYIFRWIFSTEGCDIVICAAGWRGLLWNVAERLDTRRFNAQRFVKINNGATVLRCLSPVRSLLKILAWPGLAIVMQSVANTSVDIKVKPGYPH